jgi:integrase
MRQGELFALRWCDVDLDEAVVRVRRSRTYGAIGTPKNRERRDVDLISDVVEFSGDCGASAGP